MRSGLRKAPGWALKSYNWGTSSSHWCDAAPLQHGDDGTKGNIFGGNTGWLASALAANDPCVILLCARGGTGIDSWLAGGEMRDHTDEAVAQAIERFGTHLVYVDTMVWIQGETEADSETLADAYLGGLNELRDIMRATYGAQVKWVGLRLSEYVGSGETHAYADIVRAAQDTFAAAHPEDVIYVTPTSDPAAFGDAVHYDHYYRLILGQQLYAARMVL